MNKLYEKLNKKTGDFIEKDTWWSNGILMIITPIIVIILFWIAMVFFNFVGESIRSNPYGGYDEWPVGEPYAPYGQ